MRSRHRNGMTGILGLGFAVCLASLMAQPAIAQLPSGISADDWPWWRGPGGMGAASTSFGYPETWSETERVKWRADLPGRGHGSPIVVGDSIYLPYCEEDSGAQGVMALHLSDGKELWRKVIHASGSMSKNAKSSGASGSMACDGQRLFVNFANEGRVVLTGLDLQGEILWQQEVAAYQVHQGFGASPAIHDRLVYSVADTKGGGAIVAVDRESGRIAWRRNRPSNPNYPSPIVLQAAGRLQLILTGLDQVESLHPSTGETLWKIEGSTTECVTTTVTDGKRVYSSGGYPRNHLAAIEADGSGKIAWETNDRVYVPSLLIRDGFLYGTLDAGIAACWDAATGKEMWKGRLGGDISSSPVLVGDRIYATNEAGETFVYRAIPERFELLGKNTLGEEQFATPTFCRGQILMRVAYRDGQERREQLVCIGE